MTKYISTLLELLKILSSSAKVQLSYLSGLGNLSIDELALEFDDLFLLASSRLDTGELTQAQFKLLEAIDSQLDKMSELSQNWTESSLSENKDWEEVRKLAKLCLKQFD